MFARPSADADGASPATSRPDARRAWIPGFVLAVGLIATILVTAYVTMDAKNRGRMRFDSAVRFTTEHFKKDLETYVALLSGAQGLFAVSDDVSLADFRTYVHHLELPSRYPGVAGLGFVERASSEQKDELVARMRREGFDDFHIWPDSQSAEVFPIIHLEPLDPRKLQAIGFDMYTDPVRRAAMQQACATGRPAASGKVRLSRESGDRSPIGFLIFVAVYRAGMNTDTPDARRAALDGFVYSPFRAEELLASILENNAIVNVEFYDGSPTEENLLHSSRASEAESDKPQPPAFSSVTSFEVAGHPFALRITPMASLTSDALHQLPGLTLLAGLAVSMLLYVATTSLSRARASAERRAAELAERAESRIRRTRQLALRAELSTALTSAKSSIREILRTCAEAAVRQLDVPFARIWTLNSDGSTLELQASAGLHTHLDGPHGRIAVGQFKIGRIAQARAPLVSNDISHDPLISNPEWAGAQKLTAFAGYPLLIEERLIGVLGMFAREPFAEDTLDTIEALADLLAQGIERKRAEAALRDSEERLRATFNQAAAGIALSNTQGEFEQLNQRFSEITGFVTEELTGRCWRDLIHREDVEAYTASYDRLLAGEISTFSMETRMVCRGGRVAWLHLSTSAVRDSTGRIEHTMSVVRDVSIRKRAEQTVLEQKRELEDFVSIVAHDLRHPVVSVQGLLGLLKQESLDQLDEVARENLEMAIAECSRMKAIIAQLGHIARIGSADLRPEPVKLRSFLDGAVGRFRGLIKEKNAEVSIDAPDITVLFPRVQVDEALDNLLDNALQFGCLGEDRHVEVTAHLDDGSLSIAVRDHGPGIEPRYHERIFEMFRRLDPAGPVQGTGVGLAAVQRLVKRLGGTVNIESSAGRGAKFIIHFPAPAITQA
jgi:PAS domain S-box-containing protein